MALDQGAKTLATAILKHESGGNYNAKGASGEIGGYQFMPGTWKTWAGKHLGDPNAPLTVENQNKVAYSQIKEWKDQGKSPAQIASLWNSGKENWEGNVGVNSMGVHYDVPAYVKAVSANYKALSAKNKPQVQTPTTAPVPQKGLVEKTTDFLGSTKFGKALGATAAVLTGTSDQINEAAMRGAEADRQKAELLKNPNITPLQKARIEQQLKQSTNQPVQTAAEAMPELNYTPEQIYGSALNTAALALPGSIGAGAGAKLGARIAGTAAGGLLAGATMGAGNAMQENKGVGDVALNAAKSAALGGALGAGGELVATGLSKVLPKVAGKMAGTALKEPLREVKKGIVYGNESLGEKAVRLGYKGTNNQIFNKAGQVMDEAENKLQGILESTTGTIKKDDILYNPAVVKIYEEAKSTPGMGRRVETMKRVIDEMPQEMTLPEANKMKRALYKAAGDKSYALDANLAAEKETQKAIARAIKETIEQKTAGTAGEGTVKQINQMLADHGKIRDAALDNLARNENRLKLGLTDYGALGVGGLVGGAPGAIAADAIKKFVTTTFAKTWGAFLAAKIGNAITKITPTMNSAALKLIVDGLSKIPPEELKKMDNQRLEKTISNLAAGTGTQPQRQ